MRVGLYLHRRQGVSPLLNVDGTWRAVSEDPIAGFLLIVRTGRIFTARVGTPSGVTRMSTAGYSDVPANSQVYLRPSENSTVIVHAIPHIAMGRGPYLHPPGFTGGALRMASEDSHSLSTETM